MFVITGHADGAAAAARRLSPSRSTPGALLAARRGAVPRPRRSSERGARAPARPGASTTTRRSSTTWARSSSGAGYAVRGADDCAAARALASAGFDVALVDLRLPDGDGTALAPQLKARSPDGEVILLTGFATLESAAAAVRAGACAYLVKPAPRRSCCSRSSRRCARCGCTREKRELARRAQMAEKLAAVGHA